MSLQASDHGGEDEEEKNQSSHGSNLALGEILPTVAELTHYERKLPSQITALGLAFSATFCLHSSVAR
jgi:hypothetical protein